MNTTYFLNQVMGNVFKSKTDPALPAGYYIGLSSTLPTMEGTNVNEPDDLGSGYARVQLTSLGEPVNGVITTEDTISFPESTADWGTVTHYVIYDQAEGGNLLMYDELENSRRVEMNTVVVLKPGALTLTLENVTE